MARAGNKTRVAALALLLALLLGRAEARAEDRWWGADKALHWAVSGAIGAGVHTTLWLATEEPLTVRLALATPLSLLPGLFKEIYDGSQPDNAFSGKDMLYNALGVITGVGLALGVELLVARLGAAEAEVALGWSGGGLWVRGRF